MRWTSDEDRGVPQNKAWIIFGGEKVEVPAGTPFTKIRELSNARGFGKTRIWIDEEEIHTLDDAQDTIPGGTLVEVQREDNAG